MRISEKLNVDQKTVKSATRVIEILEFFDDLQAPATVMEVADSLGYPQSSTSALLRSLVALGYINYDPYKRTYVTSSRVALLGSWMKAQFLSEGAIITMMKEISEATGDTIVLANRNGLHMQYIHVIQATSAARLHMTLGTVRPIATSGAGWALLSTLPDAEIRRVVMRINADAEEGQPLIKASELIAELEMVRARGYAFTCNMATRGGGIIAAPLPQEEGRTQMVLGIGGISEVMRARESELAAILLNAIEQHLGPVRPQPASRGPGLVPPDIAGHAAVVAPIDAAARDLERLD